MRFMAVQRVVPHVVTHPFGDERSVHQAFPAAIPDAVESTGKASHEDEFPVNWHPHRGFDIASYLRSGTGMRIVWAIVKPTRHQECSGCQQDRVSSTPKAVPTTKDSGCKDYLANESSPDTR
jgi:hypothetical protein